MGRFGTESATWLTLLHLGNVNDRFRSSKVIQMHEITKSLAEESRKVHTFSQQIAVKQQEIELNLDDYK